MKKNMLRSITKVCRWNINFMQALPIIFFLDPDLFIARQVAQQDYAMKLQEKYKKDAEEHDRKMKEVTYTL